MTTVPAPDHEHYWIDAPDDETGWYCTICGETNYPYADSPVWLPPDLSDIVEARERPAIPIYCTGACDACREYAAELGVPLIVLPPVEAVLVPPPAAPGLREAGEAALTDFIYEHGSDFDEGMWPGMAALRAALAATPGEPE